MNEVQTDKIISYLKLVANTLQTDYTDTGETKKAIINLLNETDKLSIEISGKRIVKQKTLLEHLVFPNSNPIKQATE